MSALLTAERWLAHLAPGWARNRAVARLQYQALAGVHEATRPGRNRKRAKDHGSANRIVSQDAKSLRDYARALDRDLDLVTNALNICEQNIVGSGIGVEPTPRLPGEKVNRDLAAQLADLWGDFWLRPEVTWSMDLGKAQRLLCRTWLRDGESHFQRLKGPIDHLDHGTDVPYSVELFEPDMIPLDYNDPNKNIVQGMQLNAWGRITGCYVYKRHPGDLFSYRDDLKFISADRMGRIAHITRHPQYRGMSALASVIARLSDLKEYEDAERIAAKISASLTAYIKKGDPSTYGETATTLTSGGAGEQKLRELQMRPGLIVDDLLPGEDVGMIRSDRPNPNAITWRGGQLRAVAGGVRGLSYSSLAKDYNGTFSAQRQELIETWGGNALLTEEMISQTVRVMYRDLVEVAVLAGKVKLPRNWQMRHLSAASYIRPAMPWIDPLKEALAFAEQEDRGWISAQEIIRRRGARPADILDLRADWNEQLAERGLPAAGSQPPLTPSLSADARAHARRFAAGIAQENT